MYTQQELKQQAHEYVQANRQAILEDLAALIAIPSVEGEAAPGAPFGEGPRKALDAALAMAERMGLETGHLEYKIGWAQLKGEREEYLATISHLDVVPAGNGWDADPFVMRRREGWLLGRGVADDKGASVLCLYALKFLKEKGIPLKYGVRALLGCDEETNMNDVEAYLEAMPAPVFCFTPDAEFPLCNGEKGRWAARLVSPAFKEGRILAWEGGTVENAVPDRSSALVKADPAALKEREGITLEQEGEFVRVRGWGKSGHAAMPEGTVNAIGLVANYLLDNGICTPEEKAYLELLAKLHSCTDGSALDMAADDGRFDPLTMIGGTIRMEEGCIVQTVDCRYPTNRNAELLESALQAAAGTAARVVTTGNMPPFYIEADSAPIKALLDTYSEVTGTEAKPFTMGGGTYARHFPRAVSFGPEYPGTVLPPFGGPMHGANEAVPEEGLMQALEIYILALARLQQLEL
ncbi:MAG: Sapep family Mn(2+)-dependent dipeptidase [Oscillospiraceae bacterium]|nr:Sapep family Mn(2+)-dependent dipeptidase [Oscillospiraceae bacterium]